ncbi:MAG: site-specific integrase [Eubacteriales bacterium]
MAYHQNSDGDYLFMRDGKQLLGDTFNEHLKRVCNELGIRYRSSHQIHFTVATMLYENGLTVNELSPLLGHSDTRTTWHYIRQKRPDENTTRKMLQALG